MSLKIIHDFKIGDIVKVLKGDTYISKGELGVVTETSPIDWNVSVKLFSGREWGMTNKCIELVNRTPVIMKYLINIKGEDFILFPHEVYELYLKLKRVKHKFTFRGKTIKLDNKTKEYDILFDFIKETIKRDNFFE